MATHNYLDRLNPLFRNMAEAHLKVAAADNGKGPAAERAINELAKLFAGPVREDLGLPQSKAAPHPLHATMAKDLIAGAVAGDEQKRKALEWLITQAFAASMPVTK